MKTIALALACIAAIAPPAAADDMFVPVCLPDWLADALRDFSIVVSCPMDDEGGAEEAFRPFPRMEPAEDASDTIPLNREALAPGNDPGEAFREYTIDD